MAVIITHMQLPDCCNNCCCRSLTEYCEITGEIMAMRDIQSKRSDACPLKSVDGLIDALTSHKALRCKDNTGKIFIDQADMADIIRDYCE